MKKDIEFFLRHGGKKELYELVRGCLGNFKDGDNKEQYIIKVDNFVTNIYEATKNVISQANSLEEMADIAVKFYEILRNQTYRAAMSLAGAGNMAFIIAGGKDFKEKYNNIYKQFTSKINEVRERNQPSLVEIITSKLKELDLNEEKINALYEQQKNYWTNVFNKEVWRKKLAHHKSTEEDAASMANYKIKNWLDTVLNGFGFSGIDVFGNNITKERTLDECLQVIAENV